MPDVYFYVPKEDICDVVECGMKLSEYSDQTIPVGSTSYDCIRGYMHPEDAGDIKKDESYVCVRAEIKEQYCYVGDGDLHVLAQRSSSVVDKYEKSIVSIRDYKLGSYRNPECFVTCTVIGDSIFELNDANAVPLLYNSSSELYYDCLETFLKDRCGISQKDLLACAFEYLRYQGIFRSENIDDKCDIFYNNKMEKYFALEKADCDAILEKLAYIDLLNN